MKAVSHIRGVIKLLGGLKKINHTVGVHGFLISGFEKSGNTVFQEGSSFTQPKGKQYRLSQGHGYWTCKNQPSFSRAQVPSRTPGDV
jgi:hypothetical protein